RCGLTQTVSPGTPSPCSSADGRSAGYRRASHGLSIRRRNRARQSTPLPEVTGSGVESSVRADGTGRRPVCGRLADHFAVDHDRAGDRARALRTDHEDFTPETGELLLPWQRYLWLLDLAAVGLIRDVVRHRG